MIINESTLTKEEHTNDKKFIKKLGGIHLYIYLTIIICLMIFSIPVIFTGLTPNLLDGDTFLTLHFLGELFSIISAFAIFAVLYFSFDVFKYSRNLILANTFLIVGLLDVFHVLSYNGMPDFFTFNNPNKATVFWVVARLILSVGLLISSIISRDRTTKTKKEKALIFSVILILISFFVITYYNNLLPLLYVRGYGLTELKIKLEYTIIGLLLLSGVFYIIKYDEKNKGLMVSFIVAIILNIFSELTFTLYISLFDVFNLVGHFYKVLAYFLMFRKLFILNIRKPYRKLSLLQTELKIYADNLENIVEDKTRELKDINNKLVQTNERILEDIKAAREMQETLLPQKNTFDDSVKFVAKYVPYQSISGDLYNYFKIDNDHVGMFVMDVSGHGLPSAMLTMFASRTLNGEISSYIDNGKSIPPNEILTTFYEIFNKSNFPEETHLVMQFGIFNIKTGEFTYSSAGHNCPPILIPSKKDIKVLTHNKGFPICKLGEFFKPEYENYGVKLSSGDKLLFYTDGLTEQSDENGEIYSLERLVSLLKENKELSSDELSEKIWYDLSLYKKGKSLEDDLTFFIMEVN